ncbi:prolipoprotein diacylglyceryl transferase [Bacilliculturomica massiliensis]|uniref:prolipoprotein diacylglyceryl transferase n=1 Tax=Bacilliculturomica massiliensis TaxID=1917867 RepID=UPI0010307741|nr:prolipoprotein diacylglyceryl transferase [Bacilliculturomica massiliensis]
MPTPTSRIAFTIFGLDVMWYGILITLGMALALVFAYKRAPRHHIDSEHIIDIGLICIPAAIVGARLYYVAFHWENYAGDIMKIINIRTGGLAIHGGLIFGMIAGILLCRRWKIQPLNGLDLVAPGIALAQSIGRWGNYFNGEAHGGPTNLPWAIEVNGQMVHPTFLYESIWCFLLFFLLLYIDNNRKFDGQTFLLYGILYSFERFFVEGLRTDSLMIGNTIRTAQLVSAVVFVLFILWYIYLARKNSTKGRIFY